VYLFKDISSYLFLLQFVVIFVDVVFSEGVRILSTGWGVLNHINETTPEGLQEIFATNLFGHFVMVSFN
jgi:17beta-estradiol 17-dehydrogenase/3beta-hydroxysteroid 3-dehydrogenase